MNKGRFKSQALLNEQALIACLSYVDLNPIRAGISDSLENSEFTSIKQRIDAIKSKTTDVHAHPIKLAPFIGSSQTKGGIPFALSDYDVYGYTSAMVAGSKRMALELTDWTGRSVRSDKRGFIKAETPKILKQLGLSEDSWMETIQSFSTDFHSFIGPEEQMQSICQKHKKKWLKGLQLCRKLFKHNKFCPIPI